MLNIKLKLIGHFIRNSYLHWAISRGRRDKIVKTSRCKNAAFDDDENRKTFAITTLKIILSFDIFGLQGTGWLDTFEIPVLDSLVSKFACVGLDCSNLGSNTPNIYNFLCSEFWSKYNWLKQEYFGLKDTVEYNFICSIVGGCNLGCCVFH